MNVEVWWTHGYIECCDIEQRRTQRAQKEQKTKKNKKSQQLKSGTSIAKTCKVIDMYLRHISNPY